jgi:hypothetical protein
MSSNLKVDFIEPNAETEVSIPTLDTRFAKAWVRFNGTTGAVDDSFNVSSITVNSSGDYNVNYISPLPDTSYSAVGTHSALNGNISCTVIQGLTVGYANIQTYTSSGQGSPSVVCVQIFDN